MKKVAVIGAGLSGLCTAKTFLKAGFAVSILEKGGAIGGVWAKERSYPYVKTQTTKDEYSFSDFKMPDEYPQWPSGEQVYEYLLSYCKEFNLLNSIRFHHEVMEMDWSGSTWGVKINCQGSVIIESFDFVVICSGTFHKAKIPIYPNLQNFLAGGGEVVHSSELKSVQQLKDKNVLVVGFAKSATDIASLATDYSQSVTLVYRKTQWKVPRFFANKINMKYLLFSRLSEAFFSYHTKTPFEKFLHSVGKPLVWLQWRGLELLLKWQFGLRALNMVPEHNIEDQISCSLGVEPDDFYHKIRVGKIRAIRSYLKEYTNDGMLLHDDNIVKADLVIYGTGFIQDVPFLSNTYKNLLRDKDGNFRLYRNIINPEIPNMAFVGFNSSLFTTITSEVAANWVLRLVKGQISLPSKEEMLESIRVNLQWRMKERPIASEFSATCIAPFNYHHLDELLKDMGLKTKKTRNTLVEYVKPINPQDYKLILENKGNKYSTR